GGKHHLREAGLAGTCLTEHADVIGLTRSPNASIEVLKPHRVHHLVRIGTTQVHYLVPINSERAVEKCLVDTRDASSGRWNHPQNIWLERAPVLSKRGAHDQVGHSSVLTVCDRGNLT